MQNGSCTFENALNVDYFCAFVSIMNDLYEIIGYFYSCFDFYLCSAHNFEPEN